MTSSALSVQLYTVREVIQEDLPGTLKRIAEIGFTQVEPFNVVAFPELGAALTDAGLSAPTAHQHFVGEADLAPAFEAARAAGISRLIDPHVPAARWQTVEDIAEIAAQLNSAATVAADYGLSVGYHNHAHELVSVIDGTTALEIFAAQLDDEVKLEVDTYWALVGGQDPVELLGRLGDKVAALHVKDGPGSKDNKDQVAVGKGTLPIRAIIEAAPSALRVVELDDSREDRFQAIADSYAYLVAEKLA